MLTLQEAKNLVRGQRLATAKGEVWVVDDVFSPPNGRTVEVHIHRETDGMKSTFTEARAGLFSMAEPGGFVDLTKEPDKALPEAALDALRETVKGASQEVVIDKPPEEIAEADIQPRIEDQFTEEPELQKPAAKKTGKKKPK